MIKPSEVNTESRPSHAPEHLEACERQFDAAIRAAERIGKWPAVVGQMRDAMPSSAIQATAEAYRQVGWTVTLHPSDGSRAHIAKL